MTFFDNFCQNGGCIILVWVDWDEDDLNWRKMAPTFVWECNHDGLEDDLNWHKNGSHFCLGMYSSSDTMSLRSH
jgi:hypothetical protein